MSEITAKWAGATVAVDDTVEAVVAYVEYRKSDPLVVSVRFCTALGDVLWDIGRDLFIEALKEAPVASGLKDVRIQVSPATRQVYLTLVPSSVETTIAFPLADVEDFIQATAEAVPLGQERIKVDRAIRKILEGA